MEQALRSERRQNERPTSEVVSRDIPTSEDMTKIFSMLRASGEEPGANPSRSGEKQQPDWSASLDLVRQTAEAMRASADRAQKMEARTHAVLQRAAKELESAHARIEALEARLRASEGREKQVEARAKEAEEWLRRIHDAIAEELPSSLSLFHSLGETDPGRALPA
jgi:chromosome segregation ATPase